MENRASGCMVGWKENEVISVYETHRRKREESEESNLPSHRVQGQCEKRREGMGILHSPPFISANGVMKRAPGTFRQGTRIHDIVWKRQVGCLRNDAFQCEAKSSLALIQRLRIDSVLEGHTECVNTVDWSEEGEFLLTGGDDCHLKIWGVENHPLHLSFRSRHRGNILWCARFLPSTRNRRIVSCASDAQVCISDLERMGIRALRCHTASVSCVASVGMDPNLAISASEDGTVRQYDLRIEHKCPTKLTDRGTCSTVLIDPGFTKQQTVGCSPLRGSTKRRLSVNAVCVNPVEPFYIALGCEDTVVRVYDRRMLTVGIGDTVCIPIAGLMPAHLARLNDSEERDVQCVGLSWSWNGRDVVANYLGEDAYLFEGVLNRVVPAPVRRFTGHRNRITCKDISFIGPRSELVASGSECGSLFVWSRRHSSAPRPRPPDRRGSLSRLVHSLSRSMSGSRLFGGGSEEHAIKTAKVVFKARGDEDSVNCVQSHPCTLALATSGLESSVKIWRPTGAGEGTHFS